MYEMKLDFFQTDKSFPFFIQYGYHSGDFFRHTHTDFCELVIVMEGTACHITGADSHIVKKGDVFVLGKNTAHEYQDSRDFHICNIMFDPDHFFTGIESIKKSTGFHALFYIEPYMTREYEFKSRLTLDEEQYIYVHTLLEKMMKEYSDKEIGWDEMITAAFTELVIYLSRNYTMPQESSESGIIQLANAIAYIEKNFTQPITVEEMAAASCLSERHFSRIFKEAYNYTPLQYVIRLRLLYSIRLLKSTNMSITNIASTCGFPDNNYFARKFRAQYNMSPLTYRNSVIKTTN